MIYLLDEQDLPDLRHVVRFEVNLSACRPVDLGAIAHLAVKFPSLEDISWDFQDNEKRYPALRRSSRDNFASVLQSHDFPALRTAWMNFYHRTPSNHLISPANLIFPPGQNFDSFSSSLRKISQTLTSLDLTGVVDPSLFWPHNSSSASQTAPVWPVLSKLIVRFDMTSPLGSWYFESPSINLHHDTYPEAPAEELPVYLSTDLPTHDPFDLSLERRIAGDEPQIYFRTVPNPLTLPPLLTAFCKATAHMPSLREARLFSSVVAVINGYNWGVSYFAPGQTANLDNYDDVDGELKLRRLYWTVGDWRPDAELRTLLKGIGEESFDEEMIQRFSDWENITVCIDDGDPMC